MKISFLVDGRSPIAQNWIRHFISRNYEVDVISTYSFPTETFSGASVHTVPLAFSALAQAQHDGSGSRGNGILRPMLSRLRSGKAASTMTLVQHWVGPVDVYRHVGKVTRLIEEIKPDVLHAMRLPYEGILGALAATATPLVISTWGNDLTLFARQYPLVGRLTRRALARVDALHCDCGRDLRLAAKWGFDERKPATILPGNGGVRTGLFHQGPPDAKILERFSLPKDKTFVINPRGFRPYVRNDTFFRSLPLILKARPDTFFLAVGMEKNPVAEEWVKKLGVSGSTRLLPALSPATMADLFRLSAISLSPSDHDGTPNTLLEAMACGCFPVAGDIESLREWITPGVNGLLCDQSRPESLANVVLSALRNDDLRTRAAAANQQLIAERANHERVMIKAEEFYEEVLAVTASKSRGAGQAAF